MGYHIAQIQPGTFGELSKVREELEEAVDAFGQDNPVMLLQELSDMLGAIEAVAAKYNVTLQDLVKMSEATKRAFADGTRAPRFEATSGYLDFRFDDERKQAEAAEIRQHTGIDVQAELERLLSEELAKEPGYAQRQAELTAGLVAGVQGAYRQVLEERELAKEQETLLAKLPKLEALDPRFRNICCEIPLGPPQECLLQAPETDEGVLAMVEAASKNATRRNQIELVGDDVDNILSALYGKPEEPKPKPVGMRFASNVPPHHDPSAMLTSSVLGGLQGVKKRYSAGAITR